MKDLNINLPIVLISNDDGVNAKGINCLTEAVREYAQVVVVAPDGPRSGMSSAITAGKGLEVKLLKKEKGLWVFSCSGTPVDCIKLALDNLLPRRPDLILSGINHGSNASVNILYSGTMGATLEGCVVNIPSIGFSLCNMEADANFAPSLIYIKAIVRRVLTNGLPDGVCLNVNIPDGDNIKGMKVCRQASGYWSQEFEHRIDEHGRESYWLGGFYNNSDPEDTETDDWALRHDYVAIVPCMVDMTAHKAVEELSYMNQL